jgi:four helix bundle protein
MKTHRDLSAWSGSMKLAVDLYRITNKFPNDEKFGLTGQVRRAAVSIAANISEGAARKHTKEFIQFLRFSFGSLSELETLLIIAYRINYIPTEEHQKIQGIINLLSAQISGLIRSLEKKL